MNQHAGVTFVETIPTKGRPDALYSLFASDVSLNHPSTFIGMEYSEQELYDPVFNKYPNVTRVYYNNSFRIDALPREFMRQIVYTFCNPDYYLSSDDNLYIDRKHIQHLLDVAGKYPDKALISSTNSMARHHFYKAECEAAVQKGETTVRRFGGQFMCLPRDFYSTTALDPYLSYGYENYLAMVAILKGYDLRLCVDAVHKKIRNQAGGNSGGVDGDRATKVRINKVARAAHRLMHTFGRSMLGNHNPHSKRSVAWPWKKMMNKWTGKYMDVFPVNGPTLGMPFHTDPDYGVPHELILELNELMK
jgi:hypothetical protein